MNGLDVVLIVAAVLAAIGGWRLGFMTRAVGWIGAGIGIGAAIAVIPPLLDRLGITSGGAVVMIALCVLVVLASLGQGIGVAIGSRIAPPVREGAARRIDQVGGAALRVVAVATIAWLLVPVMSQTKGWAADSTKGSTFASFSLEHLPDPPASLLELERQALDGRFPQLFTGEAPQQELPPVPTTSGVDGATMARWDRSVVKVRGEACNLIQSGSGFVVAPGVVATNAHVVAGTHDLELIATDGTRANAEVVAFDPQVDLALLSTDLNRPVLPLAASNKGDAGLVMGFPGGGPFDPSPFVVGEELHATGLDIYDRNEVNRELLVLSSDLAPGDSGSAVIRSDGGVIAVAVAISQDRPQVAYALDQRQLADLLSKPHGSAVATGPCTS